MDGRFNDLKMTLAKVQKNLEHEIRGQKLADKGVLKSDAAPVKSERNREGIQK